MPTHAASWEVLRNRVQTQVMINKEPGQVLVLYRSTPVYSRVKHAIILYTGHRATIGEDRFGYRTATTKSRMNDALRLDGQPFRVCSIKGVWHVYSTRTGASEVFGNVNGRTHQINIQTEG